VPLSTFRAWSPPDRAVAVALVVEGWDTCGGCGQGLTESTQPASVGRYAVTELLCAGCQVREATAADARTYAGRLLHVTRKPD
jgi:hypothetical protein